MNTFLSTSTNRQVSLLFSGEGSQRPRLESILFEIKIQTDICSSPFADITKHSWNKDEEEFLLMPGAIFRIESVEMNDNTWIIKLILCNQDLTDIKSVQDFLPKIQHNHQEIIQDYADCLFYMGESKRAVDIYINEIKLRMPTRDCDLLPLFNNLAVYSMRNGETDIQSVLICYQICVKLLPRQFFPVFAQIFINTANLFAQHGQNTRAQKLIYKTIGMIDNEIDGTCNAEIRRFKTILFALSYILLGVIYAQQDKDKEALEYFQSGLRIFKGHLSSSDERFGWVYFNMARVYFKQGKYNAALEFGKKTLTIYSQCLPLKHPNIADCYQHLGMFYLYNGEISKAWKSMDIALEYRLKAEPMDQISVGFSYYNIGNIFCKTDYDAQALAYYLKAKEIWCQQLSEDNFRFRELFAAIGRVYGGATGDFITARSCLEKALKIELEYLNINSQTDSTFLAQTYYSFGRNYHQCGIYNEALIYYEKSLIILKRNLPSTHIDLFHLLSYMAVTYQDLQNHILALDYHRQALDILLLQEPGCFNQELIGNTYGNIGAIYLQNNLYQEAISYFEKEINIKSEIMTSQSPALISTYINLGSAHSSLNNFTIAFDYLQQALNIAKMALPKYHEQLALIYNNLAGAYVNQGKPDQALEYAKLALEVKQNCMPSDHPSIANAYNSLGCIHATMCNYHESIRNYEAALTIFQNHHSDKHLILASINSNLGLSYYQLDLLDRAIDRAEESLTVLRSIYDENNDNPTQFAFSYDLLARIKCAQGFIEEAKYDCQKAFDLRSIELSPDNADIAISLETFGIIYNAEMKYETALIHFHKSEIILRRINNEYPMLVRIFQAIGSVFYNQAIYSKALEYYTKAIELAVKVYPTNRKIFDKLKYGLNRVMDQFLPY